LCSAALSAASFTGLALAQPGFEGPFTVDNATKENIIVGLSVSTDLETVSENWLSEPMMHDANGSSAFSADSGGYIYRPLLG
jgi:hypothetical protein